MARKLQRRDTQEPLILLAIIDVTNERTATDTLRQSEQRYRTLVNAAQEGIWRDGGITSTQKATTQPRRPRENRRGVTQTVGRQKSEQEITSEAGLGIEATSGKKRTAEFGLE